jgi:spiro-SPASM protein
MMDFSQNPAASAMVLPDFADDPQKVNVVRSQLERLAECGFWPADHTVYLMARSSECRRLLLEWTTGSSFAPLAAEDEFSFLQAILDKWMHFSHDKYYDMAMELFARDPSATQEQVRTIQRSLHTETPLLYFWEGLPMFVFEQAMDELAERHIRYMAHLSFYDNTSLLPMLVSPAVVDMLPKYPPAPGSSLRSWAVRELNNLDVELDFLQPDLTQFRYSFFIEDAWSERIRQSMEKCTTAGPLMHDVHSFCQSLESHGPALSMAPHYLEVELTDKSNDTSIFRPHPAAGSERGEMNPEMFSRLLQEYSAIAAPRASVSLGGLGEPLLHSQWDRIVDTLADFRDRFEHVFLETDGLLLDDKRLQQLLAALGEKLVVIFNVASLQEELYARLHGTEPDRLAAILANLDHCIDTLGEEQALKMQRVVLEVIKLEANDEEIESIYERYEKRCHILLQKYNSYAGCLEDLSPWDFAPLKRTFCWHLARDLNVTADGQVAFCKQTVLPTRFRTTGQNPAGTEAAESSMAALNSNLSEGLASIWEKHQQAFAQNFTGHLHTNPPCAGCDEWYTFNA